MFGCLGICGEAAGLSDHQRAMLEDAALADISFVDAQRGWAVGDRGVIWHTADAGGTWRVQHAAAGCRLESVHFIDEHSGWAAGGVIHPYTHQGQGVVLRTLDGGRTWTPIPKLVLPMLRRIQFVSPTRGWAVGLPSAMFPSGVFRTQDGGRSWSPVAGGAVEPWLCGDFRDVESGVLAGGRGSLHVVTVRGTIRSRTPSLGLRGIRDLRLVGATGGWLAGDGGLVMRSDDGGLSWQLPPRPIPAAAMTEFDFHAVAVLGPQVWLAGSPGTYVLHSPDAGNSWEMQATGQPLPLSAIAFADERHGWAAGAMGTILATRDGGRTWERQRSGGTRSAVLLLLADERELPVELVARLSGDEGYLSAAELIGRRDVGEANPFTVPADDRTHAALVSAGGSTAATTWQFPLREAGLFLSPEKVIRTWDAAHDGRAMAELEAHLVRKIRQWRPDVVVIPDPHSDDTPPEARIVARLAAEAVEAASDSTRHTRQLASTGLRPWQVKKVFSISPPGKAGDVSLTTSQLAMRLGTSLAAYCDDARGLLHEEPAVSPNLIEFRLASHHVPAELARRDVFGGIVLHAGGEARRRLGHAPAADVRLLQKQAQRRRNIGQIIARGQTAGASDAAWLGEIDDMVEGMDQRGASEIVRQLASRLENSGRADLADEALHLLVERYPQQPAADEAAMRLIRRYASAEVAWRQRQSDLARGRRATAMYKLLDGRRPALAADLGLQLAVAAAARREDEGQQATAIYRRLAGLEGNLPAAVCAKAELWLASPRTECPKPLVHCVWAAEKPFLDGRLDDAVWGAAKPMELRGRDEDAAWPAVARLARDDEFLYLAVSCRRVPGVKYLSSDETRPRDADLGSRDRVEILLDTGRDWSTFYRLAVDHRGWTAERLEGDSSWNPTWFVAAGGDEQTWTIEAAIALGDLAARPPQRGDVWGVGVQRIAPGAGFQSWSHPASAMGNAHGLGLMFFE